MHPRIVSYTSTLLALSVAFLSPSAYAVPPGTLLLTDPAGDQALPTANLPLVPWDSHLDLLALWIDSDGTNFTFTMNVTDLQADQPMATYEVSFSVGGPSLSVRCRIGDSATGLFAPQCIVSTFTSVAGLIGIGSSTTVASSFDFAANFMTATVPYTLLGVSSGDDLGAFRVTTCEARFVAFASCGVDSATTTGTYTLA